MGARAKAKRDSTNIERMACQFVETNKIRYCQHWRGHFCEICAELDLIVLLNDVLVAGRNEMSREIFSKVVSDDDDQLDLEMRQRRGVRRRGNGESKDGK